MSAKPRAMRSLAMDEKRFYLINPQTVKGRLFTAELRYSSILPPLTVHEVASRIAVIKPGKFQG
jgi:hypothetical protein